MILALAVALLIGAFLALFGAGGSILTVPVLVYLAGLAHHAGTTANILVEGYALGSLSMTSYTLDCECPPASGDDEPVTNPLPDPSVPPDQTNL